MGRRANPSDQDRGEGGARQESDAPIGGSWLRTTSIARYGRRSAGGGEFDGFETQRRCGRPDFSDGNEAVEEDGAVVIGL
jgi:hypothetical protein